MSTFHLQIPQVNARAWLNLVRLNFRSVEDLELACRVVFGQQSEVLDAVPIAYRDVKLPGKLKFGYYVDGVLLFVTTTSAVIREIMDNYSTKRLSVP